MRNVIIKMPIGNSGELHCEITEETFGHQKSCGEILTKLVTAYYDYPIKVTVETDTELIDALTEYKTRNIFNEGTE